MYNYIDWDIRMQLQLIQNIILNSYLFLTYEIFEIVFKTLRVF